jgi:putative FmdB family regulatory protein
MPTYEYECKICSHHFEVFQSMSDEPVKKCPECGKEVRRLISGGVGVIFKGSGFYVTDKDKSVPKKDVSKKNTTPASEAASKPESAPKADGVSKGDGVSKDGTVKGKAKPAA